MVLREPGEATVHRVELPEGRGVVERQRAGHDDGAGDAVGDAGRAGERVLTAHRPSEDAGPVDVEVVEEGGDVVGPVGGGAAGRGAGLAEPGPVG